MFLNAGFRLLKSNVSRPVFEHAVHVVQWQQRLVFGIWQCNEPFTRIMI